MPETIPAAVRSAASRFGDAIALAEPPLGEPAQAGPRPAEPGGTAPPGTAPPGTAPGSTAPGGTVLSYAELHERVRDVARAFITCGIEPGDRVAIWSPNTSHWVLGALGALYAGATLVPVNTRYTGPEALDVIGRSGARALLVAGRSSVPTGTRCSPQPPGMRERACPG